MQKITAQSDESKSADLLAENIDRLKELFPEVVTEGKVDFEVLKQVLGGAVDEREERYGLNWHGKRKARQLALTPSTGALRPFPDESVDWNTSQNMVIEGDNLEVLKLLQKSYARRIKLIYIDPPYNTGKDFVYPDNFQDSIRNYLEITGQVSGNGHRMSTNTEASGRFHTDWLNMIYPRIKLAHNLLSDDGVIFASCDDNEVNNLRCIMNEVFGEECFAGQICVVNNLKGRNDRTHIATSHEYLLIYSMHDFESLGLPLTSKQLSEYKHADEDGLKFQWRDLRKRGGADTRKARPNLYFPIYADPGSGECSMERSSRFSQEIYPKKSDETDGCWRWGYSRVKQAVQTLQATKVENKDRWNVSYRVYLEEDGQERVAKPKSTWFGPELSTDAATKSLRSLVPQADAFTPKPVELIKLVAYQSMDTDDLCLDFFAGSGTTGQAIMELNQQDSGNRRFILVQLPERTGQEAFPTIADLTKLRLKRAAENLREQSPLLTADYGFRVFKLDTSNIRAWDAIGEDLPKSLLDSVEHIKPDRSEQDVLFELLLKLGLELTVPIESKTIESKTVHSVGAGSVFVCLTPKIAREDLEPLAHGIASWHQELNPAGETQVVFRDSAFADDVSKSNLTAILQQHGLENVRSL